MAFACQTQTLYKKSCLNKLLKTLGLLLTHVSLVIAFLLLIKCLTKVVRFTVKCRGDWDTVDQKSFNSI